MAKNIEHFTAAQAKQLATESAARTDKQARLDAEARLPSLLQQIRAAAQCGERVLMVRVCLTGNNAVPLHTVLPLRVLLKELGYKTTCWRENLEISW
jgi:hypothetical protein